VLPGVFSLSLLMVRRGGVGRVGSGTLKAALEPALGVGLDGHRSSSLVCLKIEKICISVLQNSREKNWPVGGKVSDGLNGRWVRSEDHDFVRGVAVEVVLVESGR